MQNWLERPINTSYHARWVHSACVADTYDRYRKRGQDKIIAYGSNGLLLHSTKATDVTDIDLN